MPELRRERLKGGKATARPRAWCLASPVRALHGALVYHGGSRDLDHHDPPVTLFRYYTGDWRGSGRACLMVLALHYWPWQLARACTSVSLHFAIGNWVVVGSRVRVRRLVQRFDVVSTFPAWLAGLLPSTKALPSFMGALSTYTTLHTPSPLFEASLELSLDSGHCCAVYVHC